MDMGQRVQKSKRGEYRYSKINCRYSVRDPCIGLCVDSSESIGHASPAAAEKPRGNVDDLDEIPTLTINNSLSTLFDCRYLDRHASILSFLFFPFPDDSTRMSYSSALNAKSWKKFL